MTNEARAEAVRALLRNGQEQEAWRLLGDIDDSDLSGRVELLYLRSLCAEQLGDASEARDSISRALALDGRQPHFHLQLARLAAQDGDHEAALTSFEQALALQPTSRLAWSGLGSSLLALGRHADGVAAVARAASIDPANPEGWVSLGKALVDAGRLKDARAAYQKALLLPGRSPAAIAELAKLDFAEGDLASALSLAREAAGRPNASPDACLLAGDILRRQNDLGQALAAYRAATRAFPDDIRGQLAGASLLWELGRWREARSVYAEASAAHPASLRSALGEALTLPQVYSSVGDLQSCRDAYSDGLRRLAQLPAERFRKPVQQLLQDIRWSNFILAYQGRNDVELQSHFGGLIHATVSAGAPEWLTLSPRPVGKRARIRVGFVSHFFYDCTVGRYFSPWALGMDRSRFDVFVYYTNDAISPITRRVREAATVFRHMPEASVLKLAERIRDDALDVLIFPEVGMYADIQALASLRLAPVQCAAWGHPTTTGLPTIDWFLSCELMEPADAKAHYRERLALLPGLGTAYSRPESPVEATRADLGLPEGKNLYLIPQSAFKLHPDNDALITAVLAADRNGAGVLFAGDAPGVIDALVSRLKPRFEQHSLSTRTDLVFLPAVAHDVYLAINKHCDVMLDSVHWSGGNTALDALSVGLPIVTMPGRLMRGRQSSAMLHLLGLDDGVVSTPQEYVQAAVGLGTDPARRRALRARIGDALPGFFDDPAPIRALNDLLARLARVGTAETSAAAGPGLET